MSAFIRTTKEIPLHGVVKCRSVKQIRACGKQTERVFFSNESR